MSRTNRIKMRHRLLGSIYELIWRVRGPKWCRIPERASYAWEEADWSGE